MRAMDSGVRVSFQETAHRGVRSGRWPDPPPAGTVFSRSERRLTVCLFEEEFAPHIRVSGYSAELLRAGTVSVGEAGRPTRPSA